MTLGDILKVLFSKKNAIFANLFIKPLVNSFYEKFYIKKVLFFLLH